MSQSTNPFRHVPCAFERWLTRVCVTVILSGIALVALLLFHGSH